MWEVNANGEVDVDDHSIEDLDVSNLFIIVNAFYFILRSLFCLCVSCWFSIFCLTFYRKMSLNLRSTEGIAQILNMRYWPNVGWLDVGQEFCVLINQDEVVVIKYAENLGQYTASFSAGPTREIPSGQHGPILSTRVANQNAGFALFSRSQTQPHNSRCRDYMI